MKIKITRNTVASGRAAGAGEVLDVAESEARILFGLGKAVPHVDPQVIQVRDPEPATEVESPELKTVRRRKSTLA